ncbi:MAG: sulfatase [Gemmataceae bacterium]
MPIQPYRIAVLLLSVCFLLSASGPLNAAQPQKRPPNIIFVLVDDMGYADIGCMGCKDIRTPHIDRLAKEGVRFTNFYANAPVCTPTRAAFITGRYQQRAGLEWALGFTAEQYRRVGDKWVPEPDKLALGLPAGERTIADLLKEAGYGTAAYGKWHLGFQPEHNPTKRGFDEYFGNLLGHADFYRYVYFDGTYQLYENDKPAKAKGYLTDLYNQRATDFINRMGQKPFFLYVPHLAVHFPFQPPGRPDPPVTMENKFDGTRRDYAAMLECIDDGIGMMLAALEKQGTLDNTLFIFSSDNGGERLSDNTPLFNQKTTLWEGGIRVPCLMRWPAQLPQGKVIDQPAITMDLTATILAAAGVSLPKDRPLDGIDLLPILTGKQPPVERTFCWRVDRPGRKQKAIRHGDWKFIQDDMVELLFHLQEDIGERHNLGYQHPAIKDKLKKMLADWEADVDRQPPAFVVK